MRRCVALAALLTGLALPPFCASPARADGDPASDVLLGQSVFLSYSPVSVELQSRLFALTAAAGRARYPIRVALIAAASDLGVVPALFGRPEVYARFLSAELGAAGSEPVLVVMPGGFGLAAGGRALDLGALASLEVGAGPDGLARAAVAAVPRLAAVAGHPLSPSALASFSVRAGASAATIRDALTAILVLGALAGVGVAAGLRARLRAAR